MDLLGDVTRVLEVNVIQVIFCDRYTLIMFLLSYL